MDTGVIVEKIVPIFLFNLFSQMHKYILKNTQIRFQIRSKYSCNKEKMKKIEIFEKSG